MTFIPTQTGFMHLEDSEKLVAEPSSQIIPAWSRAISRHPPLEAIPQGSSDRSS